MLHLERELAARVMSMSCRQAWLNLESGLASSNVQVDSTSLDCSSSSFHPHIAQERATRHGPLWEFSQAVRRMSPD